MAQVITVQQAVSNANILSDADGYRYMLKFVVSAFKRNSGLGTTNFPILPIQSKGAHITKAQADLVHDDDASNEDIRNAENKVAKDLKNVLRKSNKGFMTPSELALLFQKGGRLFTNYENSMGPIKVDRLVARRHLGGTPTMAGTSFLIINATGDLMMVTTANPHTIESLEANGVKMGHIEALLLLYRGSSTFGAI